MSMPEIHANWNAERCLDHLADLDQQIRSLEDRAGWLRQMATHADNGADIARRQRAHFLAMIAAPPKVLDKRSTLQEWP